ncbi:ribulose bisphosphate carboxylase small chain [Striga asiatica]|uniref:Ribulose bisphosphate carboxylase small chain n=1 Tax=Striga asiatica TaxID=4170 RepID=A0A5A7Q750_STRAF|nr:ribulose bisphosphate carboxylase small chain [Striga asiatica]
MGRVSSHLGRSRKGTHSECHNWQVSAPARYRAASLGSECYCGSTLARSPSLAISCARGRLSTENTRKSSRVGSRARGHYFAASPQRFGTLSRALTSHSSQRARLTCGKARARTILTWEWPEMARKWFGRLSFTSVDLFNTKKTRKICESTKTQNENKNTQNTDLLFRLKWATSTEFIMEIKLGLRGLFFDLDIAASGVESNRGEKDRNTQQQDGSFGN